MSSCKKKRVPNRFLVTKVIVDELNSHLELFLKPLISINDETHLYKCFLKGFWFFSNFGIQEGDFLNVFSPRICYSEAVSNFTAILTVDNLEGLVVVKPDILISATILMSASFCLRKAWLSRLFCSFGNNKSLLTGTIVHELFQASLRQDLLSIDQIESYFKNVLLKTATLELYELEISRDELITEVIPYIKSISSWLNLYKNKDSKENLFTIQRLHEIENSIWSTKYGLNGKIDVSLEVTIHDKDNNQRTRSLIPLEIKTGKHSFSSQHMGQIILYSFIMAEKYPNFKPTDGYLLYLKDNPETKLVKSNHNVFRDMIILRNKFVNHYDKLSSVKPNIQFQELQVNGPEPIDNERFCGNCEHLLDCSLVYKCFESKNPQLSNFDMSIKGTSHLTSEDLDFFSKNISLLEIEKHHILSEDKTVHFWNIRSEDCEFSGIGLSKMKIITHESGNIQFSRSPKNESLSRKLLSGNSDMIINYSLLEGRRVVISEELISSKKAFEVYGCFCKQLCVAIGIIVKFHNMNHCVEIKLENDQINSLNSNSIYRIDFLKFTSNKAMSTNYSNILRLMLPEDGKSLELRDIIIRGIFPKHNVADSILPSMKQVYDSKPLQNLNRDQKRAVLGVLRSKCSLILGSPGSGKTQTIVALLQTLVEFGHTVLVTCFTHVAVDNILLKLLKTNIDQSKNIDFLRLGSQTRIHADLKEHSDYYRTKDWLANGDIVSLQSFYSNVPIVASTCLGINSHPLLRKRKFDFCILDEASQVYLATCLGPLYLAKNFVLVGDQKQLPPVIKSQSARKQGLEESLFTRLLSFADKDNLLSNNDDSGNNDVFEAFFNSLKNKTLIDTVRVFPLLIQYRMNGVIMDLANKLTYSNKLKCANTEIEFASLNDFYTKENVQDVSHYLKKAISPLLEDSVIFMNTDEINEAIEENVTNFEEFSNLESSKSSTYVINNFEAQLVVQLVHSLLSIYQKRGLTASNIGVISPYQRQVAHIRESLGNEFVHQQLLEINTVDQYQGRDKEVIIYSCVKSSNNDIDSKDSTETSSLTIYSELLKDERRLNVAVTRAKKKLIIIGNKKTLRYYEPYKKMFSVLKPTQYVDLSNLNCDDIINSMNISVN